MQKHCECAVLRLARGTDLRLLEDTWQISVPMVMVKAKHKLRGWRFEVSETAMAY
jgi:hypothetical protein